MTKNLTKFISILRNKKSNKKVFIESTFNVSVGSLKFSAPYGGNSFHVRVKGWPSKSSYSEERGLDSNIYLSSSG